MIGPEQVIRIVQESSKDWPAWIAAISAAVGALVMVWTLLRRRVSRRTKRDS